MTCRNFLDALIYYVPNTELDCIFATHKEPFQVFHYHKSIKIVRLVVSNQNINLFLFKNEGVCCCCVAYESGQSRQEVVAASRAADQPLSRLFIHIIVTIDPTTRSIDIYPPTTVVRHIQHILYYIPRRRRR